MKTAYTLPLLSRTGLKARRLRIHGCLTQQELADLAGVSLEEVDLFEHNLPVRLDARRKILRALWSKKSREATDKSLPWLKSSIDSALLIRLLCLPLQ